MIRRFLILGLSLVALAGGTAAAHAQSAKCVQSAPRLLAKANVLPLALDDTFEFRKKKLFLNDPDLVEKSSDKMIAAEQQRIEYGAVTTEERRARRGHYFNFWWRAKRPAKVTVRLEYRQANLGNYVQAQEIDVAAAKEGTWETNFQVTGDNYLEDGNIVAWRALVIENGKIVALTQSFLWR